MVFNYNEKFKIKITLIIQKTCFENLHYKSQKLQHFQNALFGNKLHTDQ